MIDMNKTIYLSNQFIEAGRDFSVTENRIFYLGLHGLNPYDKEFPEILITPKDIEETFGYGQAIRDCYKALPILAKKVITIPTKEGYLKTTLFEKAKIVEKKGMLIKFNKALRPYFLIGFDKED